MSLSVATIVSQPLELKYPIAAVLESAAPVADQIVVNIDIGRDPGLTARHLVSEEILFPLAQRGVLKGGMGSTLVIHSAWDWSARDGGQELARQTNLAFSYCTGDWILYLQADEVLHEDDYDLIRWLTTLPEEYAGAEFLRLYFWRDIRTLRLDWTQPLIRLIRNGKGLSTGDAMNCQVEGLVWPVDEGLPRLFHYSRLGEPEDIARRIHTLDGLFHAPETLRLPTKYDWGLRAFDTHAMTESPEGRPGSVLTPYEGAHPKAMLERLQDG